MKRLLIVTLIVANSFLWAGESELLVLHTWCELEPMIVTELEDGEYPIPREEAYRRILKEAQAIFSAMIYGFEFTYTPYDKKRNIPEIFELKPAAELIWGDSNVRIVDLEERNKKLFAKIHYGLEDFQRARRQAWSSNSIPMARGRGEANLFKGTDEKRRALHEAVKNAIRNHLRPILFNKPREITGKIIIWEEPTTIIKSGSYLTVVSIKLQVKKIIPYRIF